MAFAGNLDSLLGQLQHVYPYQNRETIRRQCAALLKDSSLECRKGTLVHNDGRESTLIQLYGTIPIFYKGSQYNIPICIHILENFPQIPPKCYVTPTNDMRVKQRHKHVDNHGLVYLPYLHQWRANQSNLVELVSYMSSVFSDDPPVYRYDPAADILLQSKQEALQLEQARQESARLHEQQQAKRRAASAAPPNSAAARKEKLVADVTAKLRTELAKFNKEATQDVDSLFEKQKKLEAGKENIDASLKKLQDEKVQLQRMLDTISQKSQDIEMWLASNESKGAELDVDSAVVCADKWSEQLLGAVASDHGIEDTTYELGRALQDERIELKAFLKSVRKMSRQQYYDRALARRIIEERSKLRGHRPQYI